MSNHELKVFVINDVKPWPNADKLDMIEIGGFVTATAKGSFSQGDLAVFIEPDFVVPVTEKEFEFLRVHQDGRPFPEKTHHRVTARKLRGTWSEGLLIKARPYTHPGQDVRALLGIERYEPPAPKQQNGASKDLSKGPAKAPPYAVPVYDLESAKRYPEALDLLLKGGNAVVTEKIHGCVPSTARITMADLSVKRIHQISVGEFVLGRNQDGTLIPSKVTAVFNNGKAPEGWLKINAPRRSAGRGSSDAALICTPNHEVWSESKQTYVEARNLVPGEQILCHRTDLDLSPLQKDILLGILLGDGSLQASSSGNMAINWGHRNEDIQYMDWIERGLGDCVRPRSSQISGYGTSMTRAGTTFSPSITNAFGDFKQDKKTVPSRVAAALTPVALAFWYMDDGSLTHSEGQEDRATLATCGFTLADCEILKAGLSRLGLESELRNTEGYWRIYFNTQAAERLFLLVAPYVPPCMQRKLPKRYRGGPGWLPSIEVAYKPSLVPLVVSSVEEADPKSTRHDIETETHNYFASGILIHNSNARFTFDGKRMHLGSRSVWRRMPRVPFWANVWRWLRRKPLIGLVGRNWWSRAIEKQPWIESWCRSHPGLVLWGEVFGPNVQDLGYGLPADEIGFRVFDVYDPETKKYWPFARLVETFCENQVVPVVLSTEPDGKSMIPGALHMREGIVVRGYFSDYFDAALPHGGRVILKLISNEYLSRP